MLIPGIIFRQVLAPDKVADPRLRFLGLLGAVLLILNAVGLGNDARCLFEELGIFDVGRFA